MFGLATVVSPDLVIDREKVTILIYDLILT